MTDLTARFEASFGALASIGRRADGWHRLAWTDEDRQARAWFVAEAEAAGLTLTEDRNANLWAWWPEPGNGAVLTGSHLDTVPGGGAYDGALGVVSGLLAVAELRRRGVRPQRPIAVVAFTDEEGGRFGTPCLGSGLLTGHYDPAAVVGRTDADGIGMQEAASAFGVDPSRFGSDPRLAERVAVAVELHVEQGRGMADLDVAVALCDRMWPHGRWRLGIEGEANHAGTTRLADRRDPVLVLAAAARAAREAAERVGAVATVGRVEVEPNAGNAVAARATCWLDARAPDDDVLEGLVAGWRGDVEEAAAAEGCEVAVRREAYTGGVAFDGALLARLDGLLGGVPRLDTGAGHDAAILARAVPAAMLFVRNPTGASHTPAEHASTADCVAGIEALEAVLEDLACR